MYWNFSLSYYLLNKNCGIGSVIQICGDMKCNLGDPQQSLKNKWNTNDSTLNDNPRTSWNPLQSFCTLSLTSPLWIPWAFSGWADPCSWPSGPTCLRSGDTRQTCSCTRSKSVPACKPGGGYWEHQHSLLHTTEPVIDKEGEKRERQV